MEVVAASVAILVLLIISGHLASIGRPRKETRRRRYFWRGLIVAGALTGLTITVYVTKLAPSDATRHETSAQGTDPPHSANVDRTEELNARFAAAEVGENIDLSDDFYAIDGHILLPSSANVSIDATGATFRGRAVFLAVGAEGLTWTGGAFVGDGTASTRVTFNLFQTGEASFNDMTFDRTISFGNHAFDLLGSKNTLIDNVTVTGYGADLDIDDLPSHAKFAEAIQVDFAHSDGVGNDKTIDLIKKHGGTFDKAPTRGVTIQHSRFEPSYDYAGSLTSWAPTPFGSHSHNPHGDNPRDLRFINNFVLHPIPLNREDSDSWTGAIHFAAASDIEISHNYFESGETDRRQSWIELPPDSNTVGSTIDVKVLANVFAGAPPAEGYLLNLANRDAEEIQGSEREILVQDNRLTSWPFGRLDGSWRLPALNSS